jgi:hypothetical protein
VAELEALMEAELEFAVTKVPSVALCCTLPHWLAHDWKAQSHFAEALWCEGTE